MRRTVLQQFDLDLADPTADLEDGRTFDAPLIEERDHLPGGLVEATLAVSPRYTAGEAGVEDLVAATGVAAVHHAKSLLPDPRFSPNCSSNGSWIRDGHINKRIDDHEFAGCP